MASNNDSGDADRAAQNDVSARSGLSQAQAWYAVAVLTIANVSGAIDRQIFTSLVAPVKRDLHLSDTQVSLLSGFGFSVFFAVFGVAIGRLVDRRRRNAIVAAGAAMWSVLTALTGITRTYTQLMLARIGVGVGEATLSPAAVSIIADAFPRRRLGTAMSTYMLGTFFGSGVAYALGAWMASKANAQGVVSLPIVGDVFPWQTVFFIIGLPGLLVAVLALTMKEPARTAGDRASAQVPISQVVSYMRRNSRTMTALCFGFLFSASVNWGIGMWLQTFFVRTHGWTITQAGSLQGALTLVLGPVGTLLGGWLADRYTQRGVVDGPIRVGMIGAGGMLIFAGLYPVLPSPMLVAALLVPVNIFAALPWGAANAAIAEAMPSRMRGQGSAIFQLIVGLSGGLGPTAVALITDKVFADDNALRWSLMSFTLVGMTLTLLLLSWGRSAFIATVAARDESRERALTGR